MRAATAGRGAVIVITLDQPSGLPPFPVEHLHWWAMSRRLNPGYLLLPLLVLAGRELAAQSDSGLRCSTLGEGRPDSMAPVDTEATPNHLPLVDEGPRDADQRAIIAHFVVTAQGRVDTSSVQVEHTNDQRWIAELRRALATASFTPARARGCPVARWSTFAVWAQH
jgi:hypothetical protein